MSGSQDHKTQDRQSAARPRRLAAFRVHAMNAQGAALAEFVLVLPWVLLVLFGIAKFGLAFNSENDETHLANEVARYATVNEDPSSQTLQTWGRSQADSKALSGQTICISFPRNETTGTSGQPGDPVEVRVSGTMNWLPILKIKPLTKSIEGRAYMRLEASPSTYSEGCG
jgi:hypothetical protein